MSLIYLFSTISGTLGAAEMFRILRDENSGICMSGPMATMGSHISVISPRDSPCVPCHWFTATPNPTTSIFKPFMFSPDVSIGCLTVSEQADDRRHQLFQGQQALRVLLENSDPKGHMILENLKEMETNCLEDVEEMMKNFDEDVFKKVSQIFLQMCTLELNFYSM